MLEYDGIDATLTLEVVVAGERWTPVASMASCGPEDGCYTVRIGDDGTASVVFGDGVTGRRPPAGARIEVAFRGGSGRPGDLASDQPGHGAIDQPGDQTAEAANDQPGDAAVALVDFWAQLGDLVRQYQDQVGAEAYLETGAGRTLLGDARDLPAAILRHGPSARLCLCLRPRRRGRGLA